MGVSRAVLHMGSRRYSSWSLRGWLAVRLAGIALDEHVIPLSGGHTAAVRAVSPSGFVPFLEHDGARVWDSLSIVEYCAEIAPAIWPGERVARAWARSVSAEMHSGFRDLRMAMPMNCCREYPGRGVSEACQGDIGRVCAIWTEALEQFGGPFLFGHDFTGADVMFAPVVSRFVTYAPALSGLAASYVDAVMRHGLMQAWYEAAADEPAEWTIAKYEVEA